MTADTLKQLAALSKKFARIDYTDDDALVEIMVEAVLESMGEVIPGFDADAITSRQKVILFKSVKDLYDDREKYGKEKQQLKIAAASMLLSEIYEPKAVQANE